MTDAGEVDETVLGIGSEELHPHLIPDVEPFLPTLDAALGTKSSKDLGPCESQVLYIPPGYLLFSRGGSLVIQRFDEHGLKFVGEPVPVAEQVGSSAVGGSDFRASDNGLLV